ncbi:MAG: ATP-binding cassette domain-containing protein [Clostridium sp.]|nr:ATP-binding cassette domain-containing protein [Clostridium sp.]
MLINYHNVDIHHGDNPVLRDVSFQVNEGEFIYIVGKVGSGKTSLLKTLYGELEVKDGTADVLGTDMKHVKRRQLPHLRRQLGIVFQDFQLLTDRTIRHNLDFVLKSTGWDKRKERLQRIEEVLDAVGLKDKADQMPYQLSGGEQQRVCIARALLNYPKLLLADEATGNLDRETGHNAISLLHEICNQGTAVIMTTHNEDIIRNFPGIVFRCADHRLIECTADYVTAQTWAEPAEHTEEPADDVSVVKTE